MSLASSVRSYVRSRHLIVLGTVIAASLVITKVWKSGLWSRLTNPAGPFIEFEVRLPPGILLPDDKNIELTLWTDGIGRGCGKLIVRRSVEPPDISGKCLILISSTDNFMSLRLSRFYEGYWKMPIGRYVNPHSAFSPWQRIEFMRAPSGKKELSALPHGEYYMRYLVRS
jgi:hypothetical protein